jgi:2-keto-4-pentenoate hydratase/2-oxohepta-3-ene-1,7-dioic acid hydratase in catechol pathway
MRLVSFNNGRLGVMRGDEVVDVTEMGGVAPLFWPPVGMVRLIEQFDERAGPIREALRDRPSIALTNVRLDTPIRWPNKVIAFPANYHAHIDEMRTESGSGLISKFKASGQGFFLKANSSLSGPADPIELPPLAGREIHHECELGIVIGKRGRCISESDSKAYIFGFTCLLDMVVRGKEERVMRKSYDTFCPIGPWITTVDEVPDLDQISLVLKVNGEVRQTASTRDLIVSIPEMLAMSSAVMTLEPGDIIATGTPAGVGPVKHGDVLDISIERVGSMRLPVVQSDLGNHAVWSAAKTELPA